MATVLKAETLPIRTGSDVVAVRQAARAFSVEQGLSIVDQTKLITAASEVAARRTSPTRLASSTGMRMLVGPPAPVCESEKREVLVMVTSTAQ